MMVNQSWICVACLVTGMLLGCGTSDRADSTVVPPTPEPTFKTDEPPAAEPPGTIEMPSEVVEQPTTEQPTDADGGFQMPEDAQVPDASQSSNDETESSSSPEGSTPTASSAAVELLYGTWDEIETIAQSTGKITVVDVWSLACEPCLKEFPGLVELHKSLGGSVQCIAVDIDFDGRKSRPPEYYEDRVLSFLQGVGASGFPIYISQTPSDDVFAATELVSIPAVLVYDSDGKMARVFVDAGETAGFTYQDDVIPLVTKLAG